MNNSKILAARFYQDQLPKIIISEGLAINPIRLDPNKVSLLRADKLNHLLWLAQEIPNLIINNRREKAMRWLCFIQGSLWALGLITIAEAKNQNRPS